MVPVAVRGPVAVCGLAAEARIARAAGFARIVVGGGDAGRLAAGIAALREGASSLISFGIAGGLDPGLRAGSVILAGEIVGEAGRWVVPEALRRRLEVLAPGMGAVAGSVLGARAILATAAGKNAARQRTGASAVDLESAIVAESAALSGLPFVALRAVADGAADDLPEAALLPLYPEGTPRLAPILACVLRRPGQLVPLVRLARQTRIALDALHGPAEALHRFVITL